MGPGIIVQVDETMLNHKVKAHRGRGPINQTWLMTIVNTSTLPSSEFVSLIQNKSAS